MNQRRKTVLVSGATGMLGRALCVALESAGHSVRRLARGADADVKWDVDAGTIDAGAMADVDVVVHLAGEPVAQRWTTATKTRILKSRVGGAELLVRAMLKEPITPDYITASGINYYGHQCGAGVTECGLSNNLKPFQTNSTPSRSISNVFCSGFGRFNRFESNAHVKQVSGNLGC